MPRKNASATRNNPVADVESPPWRLSFCAGALLGAAAMYALAPMLPPASVIPKIVEQAADLSPEKKLADLTFTFYNELKNAEIAVPVGPSKDAAQDAINYTYLLQAGSFKYVKDADSLRVELLLLNLEAAVEAVTLGSGEIWHRVLVGPFDNMSKVAAARVKLAQNRIDSLLLKREL
ncbi:MAG: SPOR domain-containing protein [Porticoccaceae bacterium]|nr:SPOR domain-containing protein [Porticoccaceae bacterium]